MTKKVVSILIVFFVFAFAKAQILDPVKWTTKIEKKSDAQYRLIFEGIIDQGWHLYSQFTPEGGPLPMEIIFENKKNNYEFVGKAKEGKTTTAYNDVFEVNETFFVNKAQIQQDISILNSKTKTIEVVLNYQVCKESCINLEKKFSIAIPAAAGVAIVSIKQDSLVNDVKNTNSITNTNSDSTPKKQAQIQSKSDKKGLWTLFFIAFISGFAALLTPCVFPMIPMTVSFFTKQSKTRASGIRNAIFYGFAIVFIYIVLGSIVSWIFGAGALNELSTNVWFNLILFVLLIVFGASFLGAFEIVLPNSWANKIDNQADKGGIIGILFMALALAIVSFSCTGPIVGTLLVEAASKGGIAPIVGMLGFSSALALPFMAFALFPTWLHSLPKSGSWLNSVKVVLGFFELAFALKFLSNADLVLQLHYLEREVFLALWIAIFGTLSLYLFGKIALPHDNPTTNISVGRFSFGILVLSFTVYMIPGLWGAPVKLINAFVPPLEYSESPMGIGNSKQNFTTTILPEGAKFGPHQIVVFDDYNKGLAYAKKVNKPILLDFTGYACVNCRKMENNVWSSPSILPILKNEIVLISLYVDYKRKLPENEQFISKTSGIKIETIGDKWTEFMISKYKTNTQPLYVLIDLNGSNLNTKNPTISYTDVEEFEIWLKTGISKFEK